ncbi:uncharacterized protein (DUF1499 family) [Lewinella aquimaris]|uniref:Uncharacterized protein (DUF1499 family) n=1 Tax=Neolewinella aquimaris TaxID=1835722 RepID=A0A840EAF7_9BACT|nr:DUF1499 domain-containing protein [Neolewinella aquimaris]MBB4078799.1 uncharacterized protein (DUF1499 family) [Neolewinella aquimaris]
MLPTTGRVAPPQPETTTIAFGSCNRQDAPQGYWETIASHRPAAWLWLGDNIYSDTDNMDRMQADYDQLTGTPEYAAFVATTPLIYGAWDDHDYGKNDAGKEWYAKDDAKRLMMDFLRVPADAAVRHREGTYQSYLIGNIKVILLDTRYFRDTLAPAVRSGDRYGPNETGDVLGEQQWTWLEAELRDSDADAHLIGSSIQVLPTDHGYEKWANFPNARARLLRLLADTRPAMPLLLSGDRHLAEFMVDSLGEYAVYEMTSSGLTHAYENAREANDKRIGPLITERNYGLLHFSSNSDGVQLTAEVRALDDDAVVASLSLPGGRTNIAEGGTLDAHKAPVSRTLKPCPESPNCVSTQSTQAKKKRDPIPFTGTAEAAKEKLKGIINKLSRTTLIEENDKYLHYTFTTWPIPYIDDVEFLIDADRKVIHYRSASRVGHSDLGVNSRRMAKVVAAFEAE